MLAEDREQWIAILDAAAQNPPDAMNAEWEWLMDELGLPFDYYLAVCETIQQDRWRKAKNPRAYIKTVAKREAVKMGLLDTPDKKLVLVRPKEKKGGGHTCPAEVLGYLAEKFGGSEAMPGSDGVWRRGDGSEDYDDYPEWKVDFDSPWDYLLSKLPDNLKMEKPISAKTEVGCEQLNAVSEDFYAPRRVMPNWKAWAELARLDEWEQLALKCRFSQKSREKALAEQPDEASRKALQAAWKRFDRTGMNRLQNALKIYPVKDVPDETLSDTR